MLARHSHLVAVLVGLSIAFTAGPASAQFGLPPLKKLFGLGDQPATESTTEEAAEDAPDPIPKSDTPDTAKKSEDDDETQLPARPKKEINPREIRLHLLDGSVISGELTVEDITVATEFGKLVVPITSIRSFRPGLDSYPQISAQLETLIAGLGSDDYKTREQCHKELSRLGLKVQGELERRSESDNAEQKRHIQELLKEFETLAEELEADDESDESNALWIRQDTVETLHFTMVGDIAPKTFTINSKYGPLTVKLEDVRMADRDLGEVETIRRRVVVSGLNLVQMSFKNSGLRVEPGDEIAMTAEGQIVMSPWGSNQSSGPDGGSNYGWYVQGKIEGGALVGRIGSNGQIFKVGSKHKLVAKKSGVLHFAVAMQAQYAQQGYTFPGQYNVRIKVERR